MSIFFYKDKGNILQLKNNMEWRIFGTVLT